MGTALRIPFFNYPEIFKRHQTQLAAIFDSVGNRGAFIDQIDLSDFEKALAKFTGAKFALGVANGTDALILLNRAAGIGTGDEVIFCTHTFVATAASVHFCGATPVPVDCGSDHCIDADAIEAAITSKTKAILPTQLNGRVSDMEKILALAKKYGLLVVEDAAQALGARYKGQSAGTFDVGGGISFYPAKTLGCLGDGGAILTNDETIYEKCRIMRDHGRGRDGMISMWGLNSRLDNLQAAFLSYRLSYYEQSIERRRRTAGIFHELISGVKEVHLPPPPIDGDHFDIFQNYEIEADRRDELALHLRNLGIGSLVQWGGRGLHQYPALGFTQSLPRSEARLEKMIMLPMNDLLTDADAKDIAEAVLKFYRG